MRTQFFLYLTIILIAILSFWFSLRSGTALNLTNPEDAFIFYNIRLPRTLAAFTTGSLLSLAGVLMQLLLQNPLADPYILGTSSGALLLTLLCMLLGFSVDTFLLAAWGGALLTMLLMIFLARKHQFKTHTILLSGIAISSGFSAGISLILLLTPAANLHPMLFWLTGDLNAITYSKVPFIVLGVGFCLSYLLAPGFNLFALGELKAQTLGLNGKKYRILIYFLSSLLTAAAVTLAGAIGFMGLVIPHLTRKLIGEDHRLLIPLSVLLGGSLLTTADTFARTLFAPQQLPVGIMMALIGVPCFIWLIQK